jgi:hypothetical protein
MERDLRKLTLDRMLEVGVVYFYERDIDYDKIMEWYEDTSIDTDIDLEVELSREQELSNMIHNLTLEILKASGNEIKPLNHIYYCDYEGVVIHFNDGTHIYIENDIVLKGVYKFFRRYGYNKKDLTINTFKKSMYWEIGLGTEFDCEDIRICCSQFLLDSTIQVIENNLLSDEYKISTGWKI